MNSIMPSRRTLENKLNSQLFLLSCINSEEENLIKVKESMEEEDYLSERLELEELKEDVLSELKECQEKLEILNENKLVLKREGFKKGGQSW